MPIKNILLVHGAWGDGSHWRKVVPLLQAEGLTVTAAQLPLTSLADDVKKVKAALAEHEGPVVLVGHSYGGAVISSAGNDPRVAGLVYVAAYAPDTGESALDLTVKHGGPLPEGFFVPDPDGFLLINRAMFHPAFCQDVAEADAAAMNAAQKPTHPNSLQAALTEAPAWRQKPSWYALSTEDHTVVPPIQRFLVDRMKPRRVQEVAAGHASMASRPNEIAALIIEAARAL